MAHCHRRLGQTVEGRAACRAGRVRCPDDAELLFLEGKLCHEQGDRAAARSCWLRLLPQVGGANGVPAAPGSFASLDSGLRGHLVHHHLAVLAGEEGRDDEAESHWQAALAETPGFLPARIALGELYLRRGRWPELERMAEELRRDPPAAGEADVLLAACCWRGTSPPPAVSWRRFSPSPPRPPSRVSSSAMSCSSRETRLRPNPSCGRLSNATPPRPSRGAIWPSCCRRGRLREAVETARSGRDRCPGDPELLLNHGVLLRECGDLAAAESAC